MKFELALLALLVIFVPTILFFGNEEKETRVEWLDEETRCFYQGERLVNCETARDYQ